MHFSWKKLAGFVDYFYICMCVFHSIRFKVNKVLGSQRRPFFVFIPFCKLENPFFQGIFSLHKNGMEFISSEV